MRWVPPKVSPVSSSRKQTRAPTPKQLTPLREALITGDIPVFELWMAHADSARSSFVDRCIATMEALRDPYLDDQAQRAALTTKLISDLEDGLGSPKQVRDAELLISELLANPDSYQFNRASQRRLQGIAESLDARPLSTSERRRYGLHRAQLADRMVRSDGVRIDQGSRLPQDGVPVAVTRAQVFALSRLRDSMIEFCALLPNLPSEYDQTGPGDFVCAQNIIKEWNRLLETIASELALLR